jgi:hypothetical protein
MFDDGMHKDGLAGDGIFGVTIPVNSPAIQYYIYAENLNAGIFSPVRAEHEYYTLNSNYVTVLNGELVINEIMALNNSTVQTANGLYSDWVELYNNSTQTLLLDNLYLSDNSSIPTKWKFPSGTIIPANGFKIIWADDDSAPGELHSNFKLSGNGEVVYLSYPNGYVVDSITFGTQTDDITFGRYPNGTGPFVFMQPTFNTYNTLTSVDEVAGVESNFSIYPNPSTGLINVDVKNGSNIKYELRIFDVCGKAVFNKEFVSPRLTINLNVDSGIYFCRITSESKAEPIIKLVIR